MNIVKAASLAREASWTVCQSWSVHHPGTPESSVTYDPAAAIPSLPGSRHDS